MKAVFTSLLAAQQIAATGQTAGVDIGDYDGWGRIVLNSGATAAPDNTADFAIEHSDDNQSWAAAAAVSFDQVTNAAASFQVAAVNFSEMKKWARVKTTLAGTEPKVIAAVLAVGPQQYLG